MQSMLLNTSNNMCNHYAQELELVYYRISIETLQLYMYNVHIQHTWTCIIRLNCLVLIQIKMLCTVMYVSLQCWAYNPCAVEPSHQRAAADKGKPGTGAKQGKPAIQTKPASLSVNNAQTSKASTAKIMVSLNWSCRQAKTVHYIYMCTVYPTCTYMYMYAGTSCVLLGGCSCILTYIRLFHLNFSYRLGYRSLHVRVVTCMVHALCWSTVM